MRRGVWLVAAAALVVTSCSGDDAAAPATTAETGPPSTSSSGGGEIALPEWEPDTRSRQLAHEMSSSGEVTLQDAIDVLGLRVPDFPGATPSRLPTGEPLSVSYALSLLLPRRAELTEEQQAALDAYLGDGEELGAVDADGEPVPLDDDSAASISAPSGWRRPEATMQKYLMLLGQVQEAWEGRYPSHPRHDRYTLGWFSVPGWPWMFAFEDAVDGELICRIRINVSFRDVNPSDDQIRSFLAHELFHCMQWRWASTPLNAPFGGLPVYNPHPWLYEGSADWAAADLYREQNIDYNDLRAYWFSHSADPLGARSYDAWPLFENAFQNGYDDIYDRIRAMHVSPSWGVGRTLEEGGLDGDVFRMLWSSRTLRRAAWGDDWHLDWVWKGFESNPPLDNDITVSGIGLGSYKLDGLGEFSQPQLRVPVSSQVGLLTVSPVGAPLTTHTAVGTRTVGDGSSGRFCFDPSGCECPAGQSSNAWPMEDDEMLFSFAASEEPPTSTLVATEWNPETQCEDEEPQDGTSNGDPHLVTFDGLPFDVVTLGEFVVARDPAGDLEVQTRHEPIGFGAGTSAVALTDGSTRVTFTMPELSALAELTVRVDGAAEDRREFRAGLLRVSVGDEESVVTWPDGSTVRMRWFLGWFVTVTVPPERAARMEGLLGSADGDLRNDLRYPDGIVADTNDAEAYESAFARAWAVDEATTLFDYEPGQSVASLRVPHPTPEPPDIDPEVLARCAAALGAAAAAADVRSCAYDVAATGDEGFVDVYVTVVDRRADGPELGEVDPDIGLTVPRPRPEATAAPAIEGRAGEPTLVLAASEEATVDATAGAVVFARIGDCGDEYLDVVVTRVGSTDDLARSTLCDPSGLPAVGMGDDDEWINGEAYVWLPDTGTYNVAVDTLGDPDDAAAVDIYLDPSPTIVETDALADGDRTTLDGLGDTVVYLAPPDAELAAAGLDVACSVTIYWTEQFPHPDPRDLGVCEHAAEIDFPPTDKVVPVVVFNRTGEPVTVELTPTP